ncbi:zf-HC2 domain-containing protein [Streptomyces sp. NPDC005728]|uniref:zf-HC2 domain-containing protein n=1 Tax=Streptomyces sp. NPDC005728 TaxID=3157054 RepID=UPI00340F106C
MSSDANCEKVREIGAELALGVLPGRERAEAVAHLDRCADCREYVEQLTLVGDGLIGLLPDREPPPGFETRVARSLAQNATAHEVRQSARASGTGHQGLRGRARRARLRIASVAVALAVACGFAGWAIGTAVEEVTASAPAAVESEPVLVGDLASAGGGTEPVGEVYAHPGNPGWVFMTVGLTGPGTAYSGKVSCLLERSDGTTVRVGQFDLRDGHGQWGASVPVDPRAVSGARVVSADGTVLASADLQTGQVVTREA